MANELWRGKAGKLSKEDYLQLRAKNYRDIRRMNSPNKDIQTILLDVGRAGLVVEIYPD